VLVDAGEVAGGVGFVGALQLKVAKTKTRVVGRARYFM
jgi:hypothetical protein